MLDYRKLKSKITLRGINITELVEKLDAIGIKISVPAFYVKMRGETEFTRSEIQGIKEVLNLSDAEVMDIFFDGEQK